MHQTPLHELFNLRWYIQHLNDQSEDENETPLSEENLMKQTNWKFIKYVIHNKHSMTPEQLKKKPFESIIKTKQHEELDTGEGESNKDEEESTTSSEMSEHYSPSDTTADDTEESKSTEIQQVHNILNETTHDEDDLSEDEHVTETEPHTVNGEQNNGKENKLLTTNFQVKK